MARDWAWALPVTPAQKLVITALAERADDAGNCFPSLAHLTGMTGLARSTVAFTLQQLEAEHRIVRLRGGGRRSTLYRLLISEPDAASERPGVGRATPEDTTGRRSQGAMSGPAGGAVEKPVVRETDPGRPAGRPQQSDSRTAAVRPADPSGPGDRLQASGGGTPAVRETDPSGPADGLVREPVVRQPNPSSPTARPQLSGSRTAAVREPDPNRQYNRHST